MHALIASLLFFFATALFAEPVTIATWNIEHLRSEINQGAVKRSLEDFERLARYAEVLSADVIALQEVDGPEAAGRVFDPNAYNFFFEDRNNPQRTGFAVRKTISVVQNPDFADLNTSGGLRHGTDITVTVGGKEIRLLSIHLKSGCFEGVLRPGNSNCGKLLRQLPVLERWIDERAEENTPFVVLGDWNRRFDAPGDTFWPEIDDSDPVNSDLSRVTEGKLSECWGGEFPLYIDHIAFDKQSTAWVVPDSFRQVLFDQTDQPFKDKLSDHCPMVALVDVSLNGGGDGNPLRDQLLERIETIERELHELRTLIEAL